MSHWYSKCTAAMGNASSGAASLNKCCQEGDEEKLTKLLGKDAKHVNATDAQIPLGRTPIFAACAFGDADTAARMVRVLVKHGASADHADEAGYVPLMVAARGDGLDTVTRLINAKADVNAVNEKAERVRDCGGLCVRVCASVGLHTCVPKCCARKDP